MKYSGDLNTKQVGYLNGPKEVRRHALIASPRLCLGRASVNAPKYGTRKESWEQIYKKLTGLLGGQFNNALQVTVL